jgi:hypothetical protein
VGYDIPACVFDQQVSVIGCDHVVEHAQTEPLLGFENPAQITAPVDHFERSGISSRVPLLNGLNGAQRLND